MLWLVYWIWIVFSRGVVIKWEDANFKVSQESIKTRPAAE